MRKASLTVLVFLVVCGLSFAAPRKGGTQQTFTGEITDSMCAKMGSHKQMITMDPSIHTARQCTLECVKMGAEFVLYNPGTKHTYQLDDQTKPRGFAGEKVKVTGTYDKTTNTIHVESIAVSS